MKSALHVDCWSKLWKGFSAVRQRFRFPKPHPHLHTILHCACLTISTSFFHKQTQIPTHKIYQTHAIALDFPSNQARLKKHWLVFWKLCFAHGSLVTVQHTLRQPKMNKQWRCAGSAVGKPSAPFRTHAGCLLGAVTLLLEVLWRLAFPTKILVAVPLNVQRRQDSLAWESVVSSVGFISLSYFF